MITARAPWRNGARLFRTHKQSLRHQSNHHTPKDSKGEPIDIPVQASWYRRLGPVTEFFGWFHRTQTKRPLTVQLCTSSIVYLCGDLLAQDIGGEPYDGQRTLRMLTIGAVASIPGYRWYEDLKHGISRSTNTSIGSSFWATTSTTRRNGDQ